MSPMVFSEFEEAFWSIGRIGRNWVSQVIPCDQLISQLEKRKFNERERQKREGQRGASPQHKCNNKGSKADPKKMFTVGHDMRNDAWVKQVNAIR